MHAKIMGVLNVTPDSFYDGGSYFEYDKALERVREMLREGADIIDIGGESTRPPTRFHLAHGEVVELSEAEEGRRVLPIVAQALREMSTQSLSVDTRRPAIAAAAIELGAKMINYVTDAVTAEMATVLAADPAVQIVICHMRGKPKSMQEGNFYEGPIVPHLLAWFELQIDKLKAYGVQPGQIILDPGIGFGKKKPDQDLEILRGLRALKGLGFPVLIGLSRKSFMGHILGKHAAELLPPSLALNAWALWQGVDIIRVHDVREHKDVLALLAQLLPSSLDSSQIL